MVSERRQQLQILFYLYEFFLSKDNYRDREQINGCRSKGQEQKGMMKLFEVIISILKLNYGDGHTSV